MKFFPSKVFVVMTILIFIAGTVLFGTLYRLGFFKTSHPIIQEENIPQTNEIQAIDTQTSSTVVVERPQPEIAVNEYWDFAKLPNRHIYINNTDRNVVYTLDDAGKIIGTVWGKDYGLDHFEPRLINKGPRPLLLLRNNGEDGGRVVVVDPMTGAVLWHKKLDGYFDGPQMQVLSDGTWIMEEYGRSVKGVHVMRVNPETGALLWEIKDREFYGIYWSEYKTPPGQFAVSSGGIGRGRWSFKYVLQALGSSSTPAGTIISREVRIDDQEIGGYDTTAPLHLLWLPDQKLITLIDKDGSKQWSVQSGDKLYDIAMSRPNGATQFFIYPTKIVAQYYDGEGAQYPVWDVFSTQSGKFLWHKDFAGIGYGIFKTGELDGVIVTGQSKLSSCASMCKNETCSGWICFDRPPTVECVACREKEQNDPDYIGVRYQAFDGETGELLWVHGAKQIFVREYNPKEHRIELVEDGKLLFLDPKTGEVINESPLELE